MTNRVVRAVKLALAFLTVVPIRFGDVEVSDNDLAASRYAYPAVGAAIGLALAGLSWILAKVGASPGVAAFLLVAFWASLTGGLHLDGLADTADGLFLWGDPTRRLEVMRDPRVGSYGLTAVVLVILGKFAVLNDLLGTSRAWAVFGSAVIGRTLVLVSAGTASYARHQGTGRILIEATTLRDASGAAALTLVIGILAAGWPGLVAGALALVLAWGLTRLAVARLGGVTGDTLGALVEAGELLVLLAASVLSSAGG
jgi:adenosylcobinamide-GDP ribazoletransferase